MSYVTPKRVLAMTCAVAALAIVPLASPGGAAAAPQCTKLVSPAPVSVKGVLTINQTLSGCTPVANTGGSGKAVTNLKTLVSKVTWAGGKGTTTLKLAYKKGPTVNKCPKGTSIIVATGKVTGGTGAAVQVIKVGATYKATICVNPKDVGILMPGTAFVF